MQRASHALAHEGGVWLVDPVDGDGLHERIAALGEVRGVLQLLDRHPRDGAALAARYGVPRIETPFDGLPGHPVRDHRAHATAALARGGALVARAGASSWWPRRSARPRSSPRPASASASTPCCASPRRTA